jgi:hypothetical protein
MSQYPEENLIDRLVTYTLDLDGRFIVVEHVPARVNAETGERFFSPATVEKLQRLAQEQRPPDRMIQTPVFDFAA